MSIAEKLTTIAENVQKVYYAGFADGRKSQYDEFWDAFQENGNRTDYQWGFGGKGWTKDNFKPKYDIKPKWGGATSMFRYFGFEGNLKEHLKQLGRTLDTSGINGVTQLFYQASGITELPFLDFSNVTNKFSQNFYGCTSLQKLHFKMNKKATFDNTCFNGCSSLIDLTVEGTIGSSINLADAVSLNRAGIVSIIKALDTESTAKLTLSETAVNNIDWTGTVIDGVTYNTFDEVANTKSDWTIALA